MNDSADTPATVTTEPTSKKPLQDGLYSSDSHGHLLLLEHKPTRVSCIICRETAQAKKEEATAFVEKHGRLSNFLAPDENSYFRLQIHHLLDLLRAGGDLVFKGALDQETTINGLQANGFCFVDAVAAARKELEFIPK